MADYPSSATTSKGHPGLEHQNTREQGLHFLPEASQDLQLGNICVHAIDNITAASCDKGA